MQIIIRAKCEETMNSVLRDRGKQLDFHVRRASRGSPGAVGAGHANRRGSENMRRARETRCACDRAQRNVIELRHDLAQEPGAIQSAPGVIVSAQVRALAERIRGKCCSEAPQSREVRIRTSNGSRTNASTAGRIGSIASSANESRLRWSAWSTPSVRSRPTARSAGDDSDSSRV